MFHNLCGFNHISMSRTPCWFKISTVKIFIIVYHFMLYTILFTFHLKRYIWIWRQSPPIPNTVSRNVYPLTLIEAWWHKMFIHELTEAEWRIYASAKHTNIASNSGLSPGRRHATLGLDGLRSWVQNTATTKIVVICVKKVTYGPIMT